MRKAGDTRDKLLETAIELISRSSYSNVGVNEICECAGVTKGSFYHYFDTKAELFQAATDHYWDGIRRDMDAIFSPQNDSLTTLEGWLDFILAAQHKSCTPDKMMTSCPVFTSSAQCTESDALVRKTGMQMSEKVIKYYTPLIRALQADGHLAEPADPPALARMLMNYVQGLILSSRANNDINLLDTDLRDGVYRLINLKPEHRRTSAPAESVRGAVAAGN